MTDPLDDLAQQMQSSIDREVRDSLGEGVYRRWKAPEYFGRMEDPDASAVLAGSCGDIMEIYLRVRDHRITACSFATTGCGPSLVSGSGACELALGRDLEDAAAIEGADILELLGGLPSDKEHCAHLAAQTLREAVRGYWQKDGPSRE
jgi:nitrogen fixation NifU-like protein